MKEHNWQLEEVDGGSLGVGEFWKCFACGASSGSSLGRPGRRIFYADGSGLALPADCDEAMRRIREHKAKKP